MNVLTVGGAMVDTIAIIRSDRIERMTMRNADADFLLLEEGRKIEASEISNHVGGGAVNAAVAMSRLGHDVSALVKLGRDQRADTVRDRLASEQVETRWIAQTDEAPTGASVMVASHERNATIFTFRGANTCLVTDDLRPEAFATDVVYITALSNASADRFGDIVHHAKTTGALVATNPGTRQLSARSGVFFDNLAAIDILCLNAAEAGVLVPQLVPRCGEGGAPLEMPEGGSAPRLARFGFVTQDFEMSLTRFMCELRAAGIPRVLITDGTDGAYLADETG
ncbi:MAG: carbohydrate kinase family protein, partial [Pseudomonadota bacterium]